MSTWIIEIWSPEGKLLQDFNKFEGAYIRQRLNNISTASFRLDINDPAVNTDILNVGRNEVKIRKGSLYFFGGVILNISGSANSRSGSISVSAASYEWFLSRRVFEETDASVTTGYTTQDIGVIISAFISETQAKQTFGFTEGVIQTSVNRTRKDIKLHDNVWDLIQLFTEDSKSNSVDFEIKPDKTWHVYYPQKGATRESVELSFPGNIVSFDYERDAGDLTTRLHVRGDGFGDVIETAEVEDTTQQGVYNLLQSVTTYSSSTTDVLEKYGNGILEQRKTPYQYLTSVVISDNDASAPRVGNFGLGDIIPIRIAWGDFLIVKANYRIEEMVIDISESRIDLSLGRE